MTEYTEGFRARMVERMSGPRAVSANALSQEVGITQPTLSRWLREAGSVAGVSKKKKRPQSKPSSPATPPARQWSAEEKVRVVLAAAGVSEQELGEFPAS